MEVIENLKNERTRDERITGAMLTCGREAVNEWIREFAWED